MFVPSFTHVNPEALEAVQAYWKGFGDARSAKDYYTLAAQYLIDTGRLDTMPSIRDLSPIEGARLMRNGDAARQEDGDRSIWSDAWATRDQR
jgi:hypothetical protein